jgi:hypothetical protein
MTCMSDSRRGCGSDIGFTDHSLVVTTNNTIADLHTLTITPAHAMSFQSAFTSRFLATDFNIVTITVSLNYTLQISHINSSLHCLTFN